MSLSFVSKSVQTGTEDGGFVEEAIEGADNQQEQEGSGVHKPLFEQLRANKEQEEAEREEYQKALMRGTLALDEDDVAHLESLRRQRQEKQNEVQRRTEEELAAFRAARAERADTGATTTPANTALGDNDDEKDKSSNHIDAASQSIPQAKARAPPVMRIKRKQPRRVRDEEGAVKKPRDSTSSDREEKDSANKALDQGGNQSAALGSLLSGYGSSDDDS